MLNILKRIFILSLLYIFLKHISNNNYSISNKRKLEEINTYSEITVTVVSND